MAKIKRTYRKVPNNGFQALSNIEPQSLSQTRYDIKQWKLAQAAAQNVDLPKVYPLQDLYTSVVQDALLTSQVNNRMLKVLGSSYGLYTAKGSKDETNTELLKQSLWFKQLMKYQLESNYFGYTLVEMIRNTQGEPEVHLVPRRNVLPRQKTVLKNTQEDKGMPYADAPEYGVWLLDFGDPADLGLLNKAVPHVLFKKFAGSCWSELCEIYGIPPRVLKTNTQDPRALQKAKSLMQNWGAAAWAIIDDTETMEWAQGINTSGDVFQNLIAHANNEISLLISGAIIGQDTKHGSKGKETSSQDVLQDIVHADKVSLEEAMNSKVIPALYRAGLLSSPELRFAFDQVEDISELWTRTKEILPFKEVDSEWIVEKFGIQVSDKVAHPAGQALQAQSFFDL